MSSLAHHGILGQKWGVRRFQNKDGSRTKAGKARELKNAIVIKKGSSIKRTTPAATDWRNGRRMYVSINNDDAKKWRDFFSKYYANPHEHTYKVKRDLYIATGKEIADIVNREFKSKADKQQFRNDVQNTNMAISNEKFRKAPDGIDQTAYDASSLMRTYSSPYSEYDTESGKRIVKALTDSGFDGLIDSFGQDVSKSPVILLDPKKKVKRKTTKSVREIQSKEVMGLMTHSSIGGNMNYIYGNTLVIGDSSYLEHHGTKGQKWGVRRFQNPDGSLTAAGRIRYGVTGAAKAAFKVGKKLGSATASAARAGVKKAKDDAYAKKKEKASQTREGVLKNKKMFTADELKALETRFKIEDEMSEASLRHGQAVARTVSQYANTTRDVLSALQTGGNAVSAITKAFADIQSYKNAKDVAEAAKKKGMTTKEFDLFLKEKYPNAKKDDGSKKKNKNTSKAEHLDPDDDDDNPPNNGGGGGGSKKQAEYAAKRQAAQEAIYNQKASGLKQREDYLNKRQDALIKVSKQRQSEQDAREADLNRRDNAASEREEKLKSATKTAADVMNMLNKRKADLDKKEAFLNSVESYRLDTLSEFKKNEEEAARRKKKNAKHSAIGEDMYADYLSEIYDPDYLEHFGVRGMKWGVRRYQNPDGTLTDAGRKHYQKKLALEKRKLTAADAARGETERWRTPATVGMGVVGAIMAATALSSAPLATIAMGAAYVSAISAGTTYGVYTLDAVASGWGAKTSRKKIAKYEKALAQSTFEIQNGVLMYGYNTSDELEHFGLKGMKWGVRRFQNKDGSLTEAGKQRYANTGNLDSGGGGGGGAPEEEDEELTKQIEEAAKKAGLSVGEYRKKFADKISEMKKIISMNPVKTAKGWTGDKKFNKEEYGDLTNRAYLNAIQNAGNLYENSRKEATNRGKTAAHYGRSSEAASKRGDTKGAEKYSEKQSEQLNKAITAEAYKDYAGDMVNAYTKAYVKRNAQFTANAKAASLKSTSARKAEKIAERNKTKAISEAKAKIKSGKLPINEVKRYAESSVSQLSSMAKAELAERERNKNLSKMGSRNAKATSHVHTNSSTTTDDARNEKNALNYKRVNSRVVSAKAKKKKDTLTYSGRKKNVTSGIGSIGKSGSGRKHSQR